MKIVKLVLLFALFILLLAGCLVFIQQNSDPMTITFMRYTSESYKWLIILVAMLLGGVLSALFFIVELILLETRNVRLRRLNSKLERALNSQKNAFLAEKLEGPKVITTPTLEEDV
jgi:uncharacterized integral membrane protein